MVANVAGTAAAQTNVAQPAIKIENIRVLVVQNLGAADEAVEALLKGNIFTVLRVETPASKATHQEFNTEATSIAGVVGRAIYGKAEYEEIHTIRVQFLRRSGSPVKSSILDTVDFRKSPKGDFELHAT
ncbi:hypothetical protein CR492_12305 [Methylocella silvestris]|uniref:Uncharacterized protein n=2 Tax=Methylocella silvestris TaxID=199596 RepID=A0A2J7TFY6_METSI|nr:hypothetical protein CR492_12305 [Methylocella silvestris]